MALNFPSSPSVNDIFTSGSSRWIWDGSSWVRQGKLGAQGAAGVQGASGAQGAQGAQGAAGVQGASGSQGAAGVQGAAGAQGAKGAQGTDGAQGAQGAAGAQGSTGASGSQGAAGAQGASGGTGSTGAQGAQGASGGTGATGAQGASGSQGAAGAQGSTGATGAQGAKGAQGSNGAQGSTGATGAQGAQGVQGDSGPVGGTSGQVLYNSGGSATSSSNFTFDGTTIRANNLYPLTDNTGVIGDAASTWSNGQFTNLTVDSTLNVRVAIDLADSDVLRLGSSDDVQVFYDGTANDLEIELEAAATQIAITDNGTYKHIITKDGKVGINTSTVTRTDLVGIGNSFQGLYISNGMLIMDNTLNGNHYIGTAFNGLMAGPVNVNGTLSIDGVWVVV